MRRSTTSQAADLLACLASQPRLPADTEITAWRYTTYDLPGKWSAEARRCAKQVLGEITGDVYWREMYAEAEAQLRGAP